MSPNYNDWALPHKNIETGEERGDRRNKQMGFFYQNHYEPDFVCQHERRIGKLGDGGKWICDPHLIVKQEKCLVYSVGSNNDFSFETFVQKDISTNCEIHTFDFGDYAKGAKEAGGVQYHQVGVGIDNPPRFKSIKTLVKELGHENRIIDVFKIDCEGCEWKTAQHWFDTSVNVTLRQIQVELRMDRTFKTRRNFLISCTNIIMSYFTRNRILPILEPSSMPSWSWHRNFQKTL